MDLETFEVCTLELFSGEDLAMGQIALLDMALCHEGLFSQDEAFGRT